MEGIFTLAAQGFSVAFTAALVVVPICIAVALRLGVVDKPGGRKTHERVTPLLGGVGIFLAAAAGLLVVRSQTGEGHAFDLRLADASAALWAALVMFLIGLIDDVFKESMVFQLKLLGQIAGVAVLMWPRLGPLLSGHGSWQEWLYQLFFLGWYLTIVNSFNFSDNMNGLMTGLSVIAFAASVIYLGSEGSLRSLVFATVLVGALLGFLPYNFPRSRIFLGGEALDLGISNLIPAVLIMGVPLYDAAFVVVMRAVDGRPIYLGDNFHLSHRLVRGGFTPVEAVVILWGLGIFVAGVGVLAAFAVPEYRYLLLVAYVFVMVAVTRWIMANERRAKSS